MIQIILKSIIALELLGISYFVFKAIFLYIKYEFKNNEIEKELPKKQFLDNPKIIEKIKNLKETPYQGY